MRNDIKENIRGALLLVPLLLIAVTLLHIARPADRYTPPEPYNSESVTPISNDSTQRKIELKTFDPNEADYRTMIDAGVPRNIAVSLIKWREAGKVFRIREDVALCYGMSDSLYFVLEPYITIGERYRITKKPDNDLTPKYRPSADSVVITYQPFSLDSVSTDYLRTIGFTRREAELVIRYRDMIGGYRSIEEFAECYAVGEERAAKLAPYIIFSPRDTTSYIRQEEIEFPIEVNSADSATLRRVYGIGEKSVMHIIRYRELLGGYYSTAQISELKMVTDENFQRIKQQIWCDSAKIKKISINFASPKVLEVHPYISNRMLRRIINHRELKGGWSTIEEMIESNIFTEEEAERIAPYLDFGTHSE